MISKEQASNALSYLNAAATHMQYESKEHEAYNESMRKGAENTLRKFITQSDAGYTEAQKEAWIENWINTLRVRFGGLDFWRLSKKWKEIHYRQTANMIVDEFDWIARNNNHYT